MDKYTTKQIESIYNFNIERVANTAPCYEMFECYLKETRPAGTKTDAEKYFQVYRKCNEYKKQFLYMMDWSHIDELEELGIPLYLETHVRERIADGQGFAKDILKYIQDELGKKLEMSKEYEEYRRLVHAKLTPKYHKSGQKSVYSWNLMSLLVLWILRIIC